MIPFYKRKLVGLPSYMKIGRFTVKEKALILQNGDNMIKEVSSLDQRENVYKELLFGNVGDSFLTEKRNILGLMFSENLLNIRLPCNVFQQARLLTANQGEFSAEEDGIIMKYMETTTSNTPWADLGRILERDERSIRVRYNYILKYQDKIGDNNKKYTAEEDVKIMLSLFNINKNALKENNFGPEADVWKQLGDDKLTGAGRGLHHFVNSKARKYAIIGTNRILYAYSGGVFYDIHPIKSTNTLQTRLPRPTDHQVLQ